MHDQVRASKQEKKKTEVEHQISKAGGWSKPPRPTRPTVHLRIRFITWVWLERIFRRTTRGHRGCDATHIIACGGLFTSRNNIQKRHDSTAGITASFEKKTKPLAMQSKNVAHESIWFPSIISTCAHGQAWTRWERGRARKDAPTLSTATFLEM